MHHRRSLDGVRRVAPHGGAWIEILLPAFDWVGELVAPHGGAWIEIILPGIDRPGAVSSPLTEGRGLKLPLGVQPLSLRPAGRPSRRGVD